MKVTNQKLPKLPTHRTMQINLTSYRMSVR
jgi:hypothetical protein